MILKRENSLEKTLIVLYFAIAVVEVATNFFLDKSIQYLIKPLITIVLVALYWCSSTQRNPLFFVVLFFLLVARMYVIPNTEDMLFLGMVAFIIHRMLVIYYIVTIVKLKDYIPPLLATLPFLFVFFYLLSMTSDITAGSYFALIIQVVLMATLSGIALSQYVMSNDKMNTWLLIFVLLSIVLYFLFFIEKFYLLDLSPSSFRSLVLILNSAVFFAFYKFVIANENLNDN